jgi:uncharacterized membrane protein
MREINERVPNVVFGVVFFGAVVVPIGSAILVVVEGYWAILSGQLFLAGVVVYLVGTSLVTARIHVPVNDRIATWSPVSPPDEWRSVRPRWGRWNHVRTTAAVVSFTLYLAAIVSFGL